MNSNLIKIGENIKELREKSDLTQKHIANFLNVDQSLISKIENGERSITSDMLEKLGDLFGIPVTAFNSEEILSQRICFSLRASEISENDLETISIINKIALNSRFMTSLLGGITID